ncbi:hypothetical protein Dimus_008833 [Dionaea muscipula]
MDFWFATLELSPGRMQVADLDSELKPRKIMSLDVCCADADLGCPDAVFGNSLCSHCLLSGGLVEFGCVVEDVLDAGSFDHVSVSIFLALTISSLVFG